MFMKFVRKRNLRSLFLKTISPILLLLRVARQIGINKWNFSSNPKIFNHSSSFPVWLGYHENTNRAYTKWYETILIDILNDSHFDYRSYFPMFWSPLNYRLADIWEYIMFIMSDTNSSIFSERRRKITANYISSRTAYSREGMFT